MNEGPDFQHPPDAPQDPLLRALRERLGENFGQAPPPGTWAAIREQLPARPRPWWLRGGRLLPLLALLGSLLLAGTLAVRQASRPRPTEAVATHPTPPAGLVPAAHKTQLPAAGQPNAPGRPAAATTTSVPSAPSTSESRPAKHASSAAVTAGAPARSPAASAATSGAAPQHSLASAALPQMPAPAATQASAAFSAAAATAAHRSALVAHTLHAQADGAHRRQLVAAASLAGRRQPRGASYPKRAAAIRNQAAAPLAASQPQAASAAQPAEAAAAPLAAGPAAAGRRRVRQSRQRELARAEATRLNAARTQPTGAPAAMAMGHHRAGKHPAARYPLTEQPTLPTSEGPRRRPEQDATPPASIAYLAGQLGRPAVATVAPLPAFLPTRPDSSGPWLPPVRRWAVQVLAGPTVSYRTLQARGLSYPATTSPNYLGSATNTSTSSLERPALGWGAQGQVRRVLAGHWALGLGLGYQEYATQLNLDVTTYASSLPSSSAAATATTAAVRQRDTYRVLTLPVQLTYVLAPPRGPLALGVLAGLEPTWYRGGRTTENSSCNCQQQEFTSAAGSPYNPSSLALSLGLDARYRLGGPAGRWQLLAQPTGRYIATPFVRSSAWTYGQRQPYSLGLLLGVAWEW